MKPLLGKTVDLPYEKALAKTEEILANEGFGILCRIDVKEKLKEKIGVEMEPYIILGACLPPMAHKAITAVPEIGIMLPCNVVVRQVEGGTRIETVNTDSMVQLFPDAEGLNEVADAVGQRLEKVLEAV
jgi:uncharacterized protein (DUF302 family)